MKTLVAAAHFVAEDTKTTVHRHGNDGMHASTHATSDSIMHDANSWQAALGTAYPAKWSMLCPSLLGRANEAPGAHVRIANIPPFQALTFWQSARLRDVVLAGHVMHACMLKDVIGIRPLIRLTLVCKLSGWSNLLHNAVPSCL